MAVRCVSCRVLPGLVFLTALLANTGVGIAQTNDKEPVAAAGDLRHVQQRLQEQWRLVPLRDGLLLAPRRPGKSFKGIELRGGAVSVDGVLVTGTELRDRIGAGADDVLQLSYLDADTLRGLAGPAPARRVDVERAGPPAEPEAAYARRRTARVRIGGDLVVEENELVEEEAVAVLGSVIVNGTVNGDVVAVGGDVRLGPKASVRGDVTAVGGTVIADQGARLLGGSHEVAIRLPHVNVAVPPFPHWQWRVSPDGRRLAGLVFGWTVTRMVVVGLLALLFTVAGRRHVAKLRATIVGIPVATGVVGLAGHLLILPALIALAFALLISLIGIPLLALMPLLLIAIALAWIGGFAAVAQVVGGWIPGLRGRPVPSLIAGLAMIWVCSLVARSLWWLGAAGWVAPALVGTLGIVIEFTAWAMALGAVVLGWIGRDWARRAEVPTMVPTVPSAPARL